MASPTPEEALILDLIRRDEGENSGLKSYITNMMAVMAFDAERRGRLISQSQLSEYTQWLAVAVTEALHYFIGHHCGAPCDELRYQSAYGAHIAHMLRDTIDDARLGYYNIPREVLTANKIGPEDLASQAYRDWVEERVKQARACFHAGRVYLGRVENLRCRIAGYAYIQRFEVVLDSIERERYRLRPKYPERKEARRAAEMMGWALWMALTRRSAVSPPAALSTR